MEMVRTAFYSEKLGALNVGTSEKLINLSMIFTPDFWAVMKAFAVR